MLIGVCSDKGSPGTTTTALALASACADRTVLIEADPQGGDLAIRLRIKGAALPEAPTVLTVATAARANRTADLLEQHAHPFTEGVSVISGALVAEQVAGVGDWEPLGDVLADSAVPVVVDFGRLHSGSRLLQVAARVDLMVVVGRADAGSVIRLRERLVRLAPALAAHRGCPPRLVPVLVCQPRHAQADLGDLRRILSETPAKPFLGAFGHVALDPASVRRLEAGEDPHGRLARTPLLRSAKLLGDQLTQVLGAEESRAPQTAATGGTR